MKNAILAFGVLGLSACASQTVNYSPSPSVKVDTEKTVAQDLDTTWSTLVSNLSKSFFVINTIEKDSRIINVTFSANNPEKYIDCGTGTSTVNGQTTYITVAQSSTYPSVYQQGIYQYVGKSIKTTSLEGRFNVFLEEISPEKTKVSANARYIFSGQIQRFTNQNQMYENNSSDLTFQSTQAGTSEGVTCSSLGKLEKDILDAAVK